jgi:hypothetical protein
MVRLGQNFLADPNLLDAIVRDAELEPGDVVLDVRQRRDPLQRRLQAAVDLDRVQVRRRGRQAPAQDPFPRPDLEHHVLRRQLGVADDRVEQVGIGEEVLAETDH